MIDCGIVVMIVHKNSRIANEVNINFTFSRDT